MNDRYSHFLTDVASYYTKKIIDHGATAPGVDWNGEDGQLLRFAQLAKILSVESESYSVNDLGCGYGALLDYLIPKYQKLEYEGIDISSSMIVAARTRHADNPRAKFRVGSKPASVRDFSIASGIFNVRLNVPNEVWLTYVKNTLDILNEHSTRGFAFNCLTVYSDIDRMQSTLYYADPLFLFDYCKKRYSINVSILHDYDLYEFTVLVRKS